MYINIQWKLHKMSMDYPSSNLLFVKTTLQTYDTFVFQMLSTISVVERELSRSVKWSRYQPKIILKEKKSASSMSRKHEGR